MGQSTGGSDGSRVTECDIRRQLWLCTLSSAGIMVTAKQQNEFRIQLQKKACRRAEKRVEVLEDDVSWKEVRSLYICYTHCVDNI